jgi:pyruvate formate lyase activating enzyme
VKKASFRFYQKLPEEIIVTGGESTLNRDYLIDIVSKLNFSYVIIETNGYLLDEGYIDDLIEAGAKEFMIDLKAYDNDLHKWYSGFSNRIILKNMRYISKKTRIIIKTVYIPSIINEVEIEKISQYISSIDPEIEYRINVFKPKKGISRTPTQHEMEKAYIKVKKHLKNVIIGRSCRRELISVKKSWITVFPDGTFQRRSKKDY